MLLSNDPKDWVASQLDPNGIFERHDLSADRPPPEKPTPKCPKCGASMSFKGKGKFGEWWGCDRWSSTGCKGSMNDADWRKSQEVPAATPSPRARAALLFPEDL